jgi:5'-3' exonuclease
MSGIRLRKRYLDCKGMTMQEAESFAHGLAEQQRDVLFQIGDLYRYCEARWPDTHHQVWPVWVSPGMLARTGGVSKSYPKEEDRQAEAPYTVYMREANRPDRIQRVQAHVDAGRTSDEARKANQEERAEEKRQRWLLAVDVHLFVHKWYHSGAGVETAMQVSQWVNRTAERLKAKGLTDVACCFDSPSSFRKALTESWDDKYKGERGPKEPELAQQLQLVRQLLEGFGYACITVDGHESDDCMASYANQFPGRVTLLSTDKDVRMCLSTKCNLLRDVEWEEDETSGELMPVYQWVSAKSHVEDGCVYNGVLVKGICPDQWDEFQILAGDPVDNISGVKGIGAKTAADLVKEFGTVEAAIEAAKADDERIKPKKREALIEFESKLEVTRQLVTLKTDLELPSGTRI